MDKLEVIFERQHAFDESIVASRHLEGISMEEWIQKEILATLSELAELLAEVNFKWWKNPKPVQMDHVKEELVDILHFFISMCDKVGMNAEELFQRYMAKNQENFDRQSGKSEKKGYEVQPN